VPHRDPDALLEGLRQIQLAHELWIEDARLLSKRLADLIMTAKYSRDELSNLIWDYSRK
jgi:hypothetical protein